MAFYDYFSNSKCWSSETSFVINEYLLKEGKGERFSADFKKRCSNNGVADFTFSGKFRFNSSDSSATSVPEPSTFAGVLAIYAGLLLKRQRNSTKA